MESPDWGSLSDDELLEKKISQLGLKLDGTPLQPLIQQLYAELSQKGLSFHPPVSHRRRMVRAGGHPGDFCSVLSHP